MTLAVDDAGDLRRLSVSATVREDPDVPDADLGQMQWTAELPPPGESACAARLAPAPAPTR
jgi:hypothetical protein